MLEDWIAGFAIFALTLSITPGPNNTLFATSGVNFGIARSVPHILGVAIGFPAMIAAVALGLWSLLSAVPGLLEALRYASMAFLVYLAWKIAGGSANNLGKPARPMRFHEAAAFQWVNPKAWLISAGAITTFGGVLADGSSAIASRLPVMCVLFFAAVIISGFTWAGIGAGLSRWLQGPRLRAANIALALLLLSSLFLT
ncbi:LysE family translocator [Nisaea sediminum]|uniref:LysE family translocator n=1 Tax=Nisaea sediminum TaxID=2775867 RepID=UPI001866CD9F|nr:LysE family translocator [Nisaea sediminum]